jgi:hypothetical protein
MALSSHAVLRSSVLPAHFAFASEMTDLLFFFTNESERGSLAASALVPEYCDELLLICESMCVIVFLSR